MIKQIGLLSDKQFLVLDAIDSNFANNACRKMNITYSHVIGLVNVFERDGMIISKKVGRRRMITLTKKGKVIRDLYKEIRRLMEK